MDQDLNLVNITKEELFSLGGNDMVWETIMNLRALCDVPDIRSWDKSQVALWLKVQVRLYKLHNNQSNKY